MKYAVMLLALVPAIVHAQPVVEERKPFAYAVEFVAPDIGLKETRLFWAFTWAELEAQYIPAGTNVRLVPLWDRPQTPLSDKRIGELWNMDKNVVRFARRVEAEHNIKGLIK